MAPPPSPLRLRACLGAAVAALAACSSDPPATNSPDVPPADLGPQDVTSQDMAPPDAPVDLPPPPDAPPPLDAAPDVAPDVALDVAPDAAPDATPDATPDAAPDAAPDTAPDAAPDAAPDVLMCPTGRVVCDGACVDTQTSAAHCGMCGRACPPGQDCTAGVCVDPPCPAGQARCGGACVDIQSDAARCGSCTTACGAGQTCVMGSCADPPCPTGQTRCAGACVDTATDVANCGMCGRACPSGTGGAAACAMGACRLACTAGLGDCDATAANGCETALATTAAHCGACGNACAAGLDCVAGACARPMHGAVVYVPGAGRLEVYSPTNNTVRPTLGATSLPALTLTAGGVASAALSGAEVLRLEGDAPFVAWIHDNGNTDQLEAASAADGALVGTELYTWAGSAVTVVTGTAAPVSVRLLDLSTTPPAEVATWGDPGAGSFRAFRVPRAGLYRVAATGAAVTAYGQSLAETYNHAGFVAADTGGLRGTSFRYAEPAGAPGVRRMMVQSLEAATTVTFRVGATTTMQTLAAAFDVGVVTVPADTLAVATSASPLFAWIEADPGNGVCDGSVSDADLVPSLRGAMLDTEFRFRTTAATADCYTTRRADVDVLGYAPGTTVRAYGPGSDTPFAMGTVGRGERLRVVTDATSLRDVRVVASAPVSVERSHANFDFLLRATSQVTYP